MILCLSNVYKESGTVPITFYDGKSKIIKMNRYDNCTMGMKKMNMEDSQKSSCIVNWPALEYKGNEDTFRLLHMASQIIGKIKLGLCSTMNHWWHVTLLLTPTGLTTGLMHFHKLSFEIRMILIEHKVTIQTSEGVREEILFADMSVADFYNKLFSTLKKLGINIKIWGVPVETEDRIPFEKDSAVRQYNRETVERFIWIMNDTEKVLEDVRSKFIGKVSPIHFFWGSFDLTLTFFSGRKAPEHPPAPNVGRSVVLEAYSHEVCSMGFWPGIGFGEPAFYSYIYPEPEGFRSYKIKPDEAGYNDQLMEFIMPYKAVEKSGSDQLLNDFFTSSLNAAFDLGEWDKGLLKK